jgi:hypothetical protein
MKEMFEFKNQKHSLRQHFSITNLEGFGPLALIVHLNVEHGKHSHDTTPFVGGGGCGSCGSPTVSLKYPILTSCRYCTKGPVSLNTVPLFMKSIWASSTREVRRFAFLCSEVEGVREESSIFSGLSNICKAKMNAFLQVNMSSQHQQLHHDHLLSILKGTRSSYASNWIITTKRLNFPRHIS